MTVSDCFILAAVDFARTADDRRWLNKRLQSAIVVADRKGDPVLDELLRIKLEINRAWFWIAA